MATGLALDEYLLKRERTSKLVRGFRTAAAYLCAWTPFAHVLLPARAESSSADDDAPNSSQAEEEPTNKTPLAYFVGLHLLREAQACSIGSCIEDQLAQRGLAGIVLHRLKLRLGGGIDANCTLAGIFPARHAEENIQKRFQAFFQSKLRDCYENTAFAVLDPSHLEFGPMIPLHAALICGTINETAGNEIVKHEDLNGYLGIVPKIPGIREFEAVRLHTKMLAKAALR